MLQEKAAKVGLKIGIYAVILLSLVLAIAWGYSAIKQSGFRKGAASVQVKWDKETKKYDDEVARLKGVISEKEKAHRADNTRITHELVQANQKHEVELANARAAATERMRLSTQRSAIYQRQASGGAVECGSLASYASRLDSALEEGRALEREYRATLGLRDGQVKALSDQITNDRKLLNTEN